MALYQLALARRPAGLPRFDEGLTLARRWCSEATALNTALTTPRRLFPKPSPPRHFWRSSHTRPAACVQRQGSIAASVLGPVHSGGCCRPARRACRPGGACPPVGGDGVLQGAHSRGAGAKMPFEFPVRARLPEGHGGGGHMAMVVCTGVCRMAVEGFPGNGPGGATGHYWQHGRDRLR